MASDELQPPGSVTPSHRSLLASYRTNAHRREDSTRHFILRDLRNFIDRGTDPLFVLAHLMCEAKRRARRLTLATRRHREEFILQRWRDAARKGYVVGDTRLPCLKRGHVPHLGETAGHFGGEAREEGENVNLC